MDKKDCPLLLYFYTGPSTFVSKDLAILQKNYRIKTFLFTPSHKLWTPITLVKQLFFILGNVLNSRVFIAQFGGYHSFLPALFSKIFNVKSLIIAGGTDCVAFPKLNYGNLRPQLLGWFTKTSYRLTNHIAPVDESLVYQDYPYIHPLAKKGKQGILAFIPNLKTPITVIHNGYDQLNDLPKTERNPRQIITVAAGAEEERRMILKGVDFLIELAEALPTFQFIIIGSKSLPISYPSNVQLIPFLPNNEVLNYFYQSTYYAQLSISEGFPNALCEAMVCGCIPITSNVGAMPLIVGDNGFVVAERNTISITNFLESIPAEQLKSKRIKARESILDRFSLTKRENLLLHLVSSLAKK